MNKKVSFGCDHRGFELKKPILTYLEKHGYEVIDCGTDSDKSVDYPDYILEAAQLVESGKCDRAVAACYSGIGSTIAANKVAGVRAALVQNAEQARLSRAHNNSNMLVLGSGFIESGQLEPILKAFLETPFEGGRHERRIDKIKEYERKHEKK